MMGEQQRTESLFYNFRLNSTTNPAGIVTRNDWGFRPRGGNGEGAGDPGVVVRRYVGDSIP